MQLCSVLKSGPQGLEPKSPAQRERLIAKAVLLEVIRGSQELEMEVLNSAWDVPVSGVSCKTWTIKILIRLGGVKRMLVSCCCLIFYIVRI